MQHLQMSRNIPSTPINGSYFIDINVSNFVGTARSPKKFSKEATWLWHFLFLFRTTSYYPPTRQANKHKSRGQNRSNGTFAILVPTSKATLNWLLRFSAVNVITLQSSFRFLSFKVFAKQKVLISGHSLWRDTLRDYEDTCPLHTWWEKLRFCPSIWFHMKQMQLIDRMWM